MHMFGNCETPEREGAPPLSSGGTRLHILDDDPKLRRSLRRMLEGFVAEIVEHGSSEEFLRAYDLTKAECLVLDIGLPGEDGLDLLQRLSAAHQMLPTVVLSAHADIERVVLAMQRGAVSFLCKPPQPERLVEAVGELAAKAGRMAEQRRVLREFVTALQQLTPREREVYESLLRGASTKQVALELGMSVRTAHIHRQNLMRKLGVESIVDLCRLADQLH